MGHCLFQRLWNKDNVFLYISYPGASWSEEIWHGTRKNYNVSPDLPSMETLPLSLYFRLGPHQMTLACYVTDRTFYKTMCAAIGKWNVKSSLLLKLATFSDLPISLYFRLGPHQMTLACYVTDRTFYKTMCAAIGKWNVKSSLVQKLANFSDSRTGETSSRALSVAVPLPRTANTVIMLGIVAIVEFKHCFALETNILRFWDRNSLGYQVKK